MDIAHRVRMGEDRDAVQDELESEPLFDSDDGEESKEVETDDSMFVVGPRVTAALATTKAIGASFSAPEARKCTVDRGTEQEEEAKRDRVGQCSTVADMKRSVERTHLKARSSVAGPTSGHEEAMPSSLTEGVGRGASPTGRATAQPVPTVANMLRLDLQPLSSIWGLGVPPLRRASG
jgi:hypothetical protein